MRNKENICPQLSARKETATLPKLALSTGVRSPQACETSRQPTWRNNENRQSDQNSTKYRNTIIRSSRASCDNELILSLYKHKAIMNQTIVKHHSRQNSLMFNFNKLEKNYKHTLVCKKKVNRRPVVVNNSNNDSYRESLEVSPDKKVMKELILPQVITEYRIGMQILRGCCKNTVFSAYRCGASLTPFEGGLHMYGGYPWNTNGNKLHLHRYNIREQNWEELPHNGDLPLFSTSNHTCETFKNSLLFIGGYGAMSITKKTRFLSKSIYAYQPDKKQWYRYDWKVGIRAHASLLYESVLIIYGGIGENQKYSSQMHFIVLNGNNISNSTSFSFDLRQHSLSQVRSLAYHKMIHTYDVQPGLKELLPYNGVYLFGGKSENQKGQQMMQNHVLFFNPKSIENKFLENKIKGWQTLVTQGRKPQSRYNHTFNILNRQACCIIVGGINKFEQTLNDVWILDLIHLNWVAATFIVPEDLIATRGLHSHCSAVINSDVYIFGGLYKNSEVNTLLIRIGNNVENENSTITQTNTALKRVNNKSKDMGSLRIGQRMLSIVISNNIQQ